MLMQDSSTPEPSKKPSKRLSYIYMAVFLLTAVVTALAIWWAARQAFVQNVQLASPQPVAVNNTEVPRLTSEAVVRGRSFIWDIAFLPDANKTMLFTERSGAVSALIDGNTREVARINDVYARGEGGLLGMAVDPDFSQNRFIYTCFNSTQGGPDVRVVRWRVADDLASLHDRNDIVVGIPSNQSGRHSGCRMAFGPDDYLWIATGDAAMGNTPQDPKGLGGKVLRVDRDGKAAAQGNVGGDFDPRIYSYGHRNSQGIAFFTRPIAGAVGVSVEHGPNVDDEVNPLRPGNFGWNPVPGYNEAVPMTDIQQFPDAVPSIWSSGRPTLAPSGMAVIKGRTWQAWNGALAVAMLKTQHLRIIRLDKDLRVTDQQEILKDRGRLRAVVQGPSNALYISTSNGQDDQIIRLTPQ